MSFQRLWICEEELKGEEREECFLELLYSRLQQKGVEVLKLTSECMEAQMCLSESVILAATDETLERFCGKEAALLAYANPTLSGQKLTAADMVIEGFEEIDHQFLERAYQRKHNEPWIITETERCVIREITLQDLDALYELYALPGITDYTEPLLERKKEEAYTRAYIDNMYRYYGYGMWVVIEKKTGRLIGRAGFDDRIIDNRAETEMGYVIATDLQRQGYATEVCQAILAYGREYCEFERINCLIYPQNNGSIAFAKSLGMERSAPVSVNGRTMERYVCILQKNAEPDF